MPGQSRGRAPTQETKSGDVSQKSAGPENTGLVGMQGTMGNAAVGDMLKQGGDAGKSKGAGGGGDVAAPKTDVDVGKGAQEPGSKSEKKSDEKVVVKSEEKSKSDTKGDGKGGGDGKGDPAGKGGGGGDPKGDGKGGAGKDGGKGGGGKDGGKDGKGGGKDGKDGAKAGGGGGARDAGSKDGGGGGGGDIAANGKAGKESVNGGGNGGGAPKGPAGGGGGGGGDLGPVVANLGDVGGFSSADVAFPTVMTPLVQGVQTPVAAAPKVDPKQEKAILDSTGKTIASHVDEVDAALSALASTSTSQQADLAAVADQVSVDVGTQMTAQSVAFDTVITSSSGDLQSTYASAATQVSSAVDAGKATVTGQVATVASTIDQTAATAQSAVVAGASQVATKLTGDNAAWAAGVRELVVKKAGDIRTKVTADADKMLGEAQNVEKAALGQQGATGAAAVDASCEIAAAKEQTKVVKKYAEAMKKLGEMGAKNLENTSSATDIMSDRLHAPTIHDLMPAAKKYEEEIKKKAEADKADAERAAEKYGTAADKTKAAATTQMLSEGKQADQTLKAADAAIDGQLDKTKAGIQNQTLDAAGALTKDHADQMAQLAAATTSNPLIPGPMASSFASSQAADMTAAHDEQVAALQSDANDALMSVDETAAGRKTQLASGASDQKSRVANAGSTMVQSTLDGTNQTTSILTQAGNASTTAMTSGGNNLVANTTKLGSEVQEHGAQYQAAEIQSKLDAYSTDLQRQIMMLQMKMVKAVEAAKSSAKDAEKADIKKRSGDVWKAIDGMGTDESGLLGAIRGMTAVKGAALKYQYQADWGNDIIADIKDDTTGAFEDDNLWKACAAYMSGDNASGAKYALAYSSSAWGSLFGTDSDLIENTLRGLDEEARNQLLADKEFPAIKAKLEMVMTAEMADPIMGANQYDLDVFRALTDKTKSAEEAATGADAVRMFQAFEGTSNPFTWGTDEAKVLELLAKNDAEGNAKLAKAYAEYSKKYSFDGKTPEALEDRIKSELAGKDDDMSPGYQEDQALALLKGNKGEARAWELKHATSGSNDAEGAMKAVEGDGNFRNSSDWLAGAEAEQENQDMRTAFKDKVGGGDIEKFIGDEFDGGSGKDDNKLDEILKDKLNKGETDASNLLAYGVVDAGTREDYVRKCFEQIKNISDINVRKMKMDELRATMKKDYGIDDLEKFLGIGKWRENSRDPNSPDFDPSFDPEIDGQDAFDVDQLFQEASLDTELVSTKFILAKNAYEFYRGTGANSAGKFVVDMFHDTGEKLDENYHKLVKLYADKSWQEKDHPKADPATKEPVAQWTTFCDLADALQRKSDIYKDQRNEMTESITGVIAVLGALVLTVATAGFGAPAAVGIIGGLVIASVNIMIKQTMMGDSYGQDDAALDMGMALADAALQMATLGMGKVAKLKGMMESLEKFAEKGIVNKFLAATLEGLPGKLKDALFKEELWRGEKLDEILINGVVVESFREASVGLVADKLKDGAGLPKTITSRSQQLLASIVDHGTAALADPEIMGGKNAGWAVLKAVGQGAAEDQAVLAARNSVLKTLTDKKKLGGSDWQNILDSHEEHRNWILAALPDAQYNAASDAEIDMLIGHADDDLKKRLEAIKEKRKAADAPVVTPAATTTTTPAETKNPDEEKAKHAADEEARLKKEADDKRIADEKKKADEEKAAANLAVDQTVTNTATTEANDGADKAKKTAPKAVLDILNTGTLAELIALPVIGEAKARAIIEYREQGGKFEKVADIEKCKKIDKADASTLAAHAKRELVKHETSNSAKALGPQFFNDLEAEKRKPENAGVDELELMKKVVKQNGGKTYALKGEQVPLADMQAAGAFTRVVGMEAAYDYHLTQAAKDQLKLDHNVNNKAEFAELMHKKTVTFDKGWLNTSSEVSGQNGVAWWSVVGSSNATTAAELISELALNEKYYKGGAIRITVSPDDAFKAKFKKPTAFDGMLFGEWVPENTGSTFGLTGGGKKEACAGPVALANATNIEVFH